MITLWGREMTKELIVISWSVTGTLSDGRKFRVTVARGSPFDGCVAD